MYTSFHISPHSQLIKAFIGPFTVVSFNRCNSLTRLIVSIYNNGSFENIWSILMFSIICISNKMHVDVKNLTQKIFTSQCCNALINLAYFTTLLLSVLLLSTSKCFLGCVEKIQKFFTFHLLKKANLLNFLVFFVPAARPKNLFVCEVFYLFVQKWRVVKSYE